MKRHEQKRAQTQAAILNAVAEAIGESGAIDFSMQEVADRAGVTHRTVYNHFPTREALNDAFAVHVERQLATAGLPPDKSLAPDQLTARLGEFYAVFDARQRHVHAYALLMLASRAPAKITRRRTAAMQALIRAQAKLRPEVSARQVTAAVRMFFSTIGWHVLIEQMGLSPEEAAATGKWATQALLDAATQPAGAKKRAKR